MTSKLGYCPLCGYHHERGAPCATRTPTEPAKVFRPVQKPQPLRPNPGSEEESKS